MSSEEMLVRQMGKLNSTVLDVVIINIRERLKTIRTRYWV